MVSSYLQTTLRNFWLANENASFPFFFDPKGDKCRVVVRVTDLFVAKCTSCISFVNLAMESDSHRRPF